MAAIRLARAGASVSLFDPSHPREKPCGGGVTGRALALIAGAVDISSLPAVVVKSAAVEPPAPLRPAASAKTAIAEVELTDRGLTPASSLAVLSRAVFDAALLGAALDAGARLVAEKVETIAVHERSVVVATPRSEHVADFVIGADGANSVVRKKLSHPFTRGEVSIAAGYFVRGTSGADIAVKCMAEQPGYLWSFPRPDHLAVGICAPAAERASAAELAAQSLAWITSRGLQHGARLEPYAWPIPSAGFTDAARLRLAGPGWMLAGDAAGLVDPLTREGIYYALLSGQWAADALIRDQARPHAAYEARLKDEIHPELNRAAALSGLFFSPAFSDLFVSALRTSAPVREVFRDLVAGTQPYDGLKWRLLATHEWKLAGRAALMVVQSAPSFFLRHHANRAPTDWSVQGV
jgi:flavin-dependent dehydrogenase